MKLVNIDDIPVTVRDHVRTGQLKYWRLIDGMPGTLENFWISLAPLRADYSTPRHRHNFEQVRYQLEGSFDYGRSGKMEAGMVGYFPEGTRYGPTASSDETLLLTVQYGGPSGGGFLSEEEQLDVVNELKKSGTFADGVYTRVDANGNKENWDGYEIMWETAMGRPLAYPQPRYNDPILMQPESFPWRRSPSESGVARKSLGRFSDPATELSFLLLDAGASVTLSDHSLYFVVSGGGEAGTRKWQARSTFHLLRKESGTIRATKESVLFHIGLPDLSHLQSLQVAGKGAAAA